MKKITYKERSNFYNNEVAKNNSDIKILKMIKDEYNVNSIIMCPCASGVYLNECAKIFKTSYFIDIECQMTRIVENNILENNITNVKTFTHNIVNINELGIKCDCILALNQGIQYLNFSEFENFLNNNYLVTNYIILDMFDFDSNGTLSYYNSSIKDNCYYLSKKFKFESMNIERYNSHLHNGNHIKFNYCYFYEKNLIFETEFKLYNYKYATLKKIIEINNKFDIKKTINYQNGSYIVVLKKKKEEVH